MLTSPCMGCVRDQVLVDRVLLIPNAQQQQHGQRSLIIRTNYTWLKNTFHELCRAPFETVGALADAVWAAVVKKLPFLDRYR